MMYCRSCGASISLEQDAKQNGYCDNCFRERPLSNRDSNNQITRRMDEITCYICDRPLFTRCYNCGKAICAYHTKERVGYFAAIRKRCPVCDQRFRRIIIIIYIAAFTVFISTMIIIISRFVQNI
ncbi:MAG: hypothetical protein JW776_11980 [Candidatus Lokiarchaeota archaeon]|nr:hypothetical protein [Candidatus Lokiarchaeota archaeon]